MPALSIRQILPALIAVPLLAATGLVSFNRFRHERQEVRQLMSTLNQETMIAVREYLLPRLKTPSHINQLNLRALESGYLDANDFPALGRHFWNQMNVFESIAYIQYGSASGDFIGIVRQPSGQLAYELKTSETQGRLVTYPATDTGEIDRQNPQIGNRYDPRRRPWYQAAQAAGKPAWSEPYRWFSQFETYAILEQTVSTAWGQAVTLAQPYPSDRQPKVGVLAVDFLLGQIEIFLQEADARNDSIVAIVDRQGNTVAKTIASSTPSPMANSGDEASDTVLTPIDPDPRLQTLIQALEEQFGRLEAIQTETEFEFEVDRNLYLARVAPLDDGDLGLNWLTIVAISDVDFLPELYEQVSSQLLTAAAIVAMVVLASILASRWIARPIERLSQAAQEVKRGRFEAGRLQDITERPDELGELAVVFRDMAVVIGDREKTLNAQLQELREPAAMVTGSSLEVAYYQSLKARAEQLRSQTGEPGNAAQFPPLGSRKAYYRTLQRHSEAARTSHLGWVEVERILRNEDYFIGLPEEDLHELARHAQRKTYVPGELVFEEGEAAQHLYALAVGTVEVSTTARDRPLRRLKAGDVFGDLALVLNAPRTATVRAVEESLVFVIDGEMFARILRDNPHVLPNVEQKLALYREELTDRQLALEEDEGEVAGEGNWFRRLGLRLQRWWAGMPETEEAERTP